MHKKKQKAGQIVVQPCLQLTILYICTVDASVYFEIEYLAPDVKVFSCMLSSLASTTLFPPKTQGAAYICCVYMLRHFVGQRTSWVYRGEVGGEHI